MNAIATTATTATATAPARALPFDAAALESLASLLTAKGADAKIGAVWPVIEAVASAVYVNGARKEQFFDAAVKNGRARHPAFAALHTGKAPVCRAFRAVIDVYASALTDKSRDLSQAAHDALLGMMADTFASAAAPAPRTSKSPGEKDAAALVRAIGIVTGAATVLSKEQAAALRAALATYDSLQDAQEPKAPATYDSLQDAQEPKAPAVAKEHAAALRAAALRAMALREAA